MEAGRGGVAPGPTRYTSNGLARENFYPKGLLGESKDKYTASCPESPFSSRVRSESESISRIPRSKPRRLRRRLRRAMNLRRAERYGRAGSSQGCELEEPAL